MFSVKGSRGPVATGAAAVVGTQEPSATKVLHIGNMENRISHGYNGDKVFKCAVEP
jgi:hypothetical protein